MQDRELTDTELEGVSAGCAKNKQADGVSTVSAARTDNGVVFRRRSRSTGGAQAAPAGGGGVCANGQCS